MQRQLQACAKYANERKCGDKLIGQYQSIANKIVQMKLRLETSRLILYKAAWLKAHNEPAFIESAMSKLLVSESYVENCRDAIQVHGAYGYTQEYGLERDLRDAIASTIYSGTSEIQKNIIASLWI